MTTYYKMISQLIDEAGNDKKELRRKIAKIKSEETLYKEVLNNTQFLTYDKVSFPTRLFYYLNNLHSLCLCQYCGKPLERNTDVFGTTLRYCSRDCSAKGGVEKGKATKLLRYGSEGYINPDKLRETWKHKSQEDLDIIHQKHIKTNMEKYGVSHPTQSPEIRQKTISTNLDRYGFDNPSKCSSVKNKIRETTFIRYGVSNVMQVYDIHERFMKTLSDRTAEEQDTINKKREDTSLRRYGTKYPSQDECIRNRISGAHRSHTTQQKEKANNKREQTCLIKYGVTNVSKVPSIVEHRKNTCIDRYGVPFPTLPNSRRSVYLYDGLYFDSSYELYYYIWAVETGHNIKRCDQKFEFTACNHSHFYFPDFIVDNELIEIKGEHFFTDEGDLYNPYTKDPDIQEVYRNKGLCMKEHNVTVVKDLTIQKNYVDDKYTTDYIYLFRVNLEFPYLNQELKDTSMMGLIHHFHKSIYEANCKNHVSPIEAWNDKELVRRCALNRLQYVQRCRPSDILQGFNVTKIAPKVSVFNPKLAASLISSYIQESNIVDPFSGFSGRLLGTLSCKKHYMGYDINAKHVKESQDIINFLNASSEAQVISQDILDSDPVSLEDTALFTCPPYSDKERWNPSDIVKDADDWIDECMTKYRCSTYLFVVDKTERFKDNIVQVITNRSHFSRSNELVLLIHSEMS